MELCRLSTQENNDGKQEPDIMCIQKDKHTNVLMFMYWKVVKVMNCHPTDTTPAHDKSAKGQYVLKLLAGPPPLSVYLSCHKDCD